MKLSETELAEEDRRKKFINEFNRPFPLPSIHGWAAWRVEDGEIVTLIPAENEAEARNFAKGINRHPERHTPGSTGHFGRITLHPFREEMRQQPKLIDSVNPKITAGK